MTLIIKAPTAPTPRQKSIRNLPILGIQLNYSLYIIIKGRIFKETEYYIIMKQLISGCLLPKASH